jgi:hypothetical protein
LNALKWSRSIRATHSGWPERTALASSRDSSSSQPPVGRPGEDVGAGQAPDLLVEGADLGQQPQQRAEQKADRDPGAEHERGRDGAFGQDRVARQGGVAQQEPAPPEGERLGPHVGAFGAEAGWGAGDQAVAANLLVVQLHPGERLRRPQRRLEEVPGPELAGGPSQERRPPLGDAADQHALPKDGYEQLERDRAPRLR